MPRCLCLVDTNADGCSCALASRRHNEQRTGGNRKGGTRQDDADDFEGGDEEDEEVRRRRQLWERRERAEYRLRAFAQPDEQGYAADMAALWGPFAD